MVYEQFTWVNFFSLNTSSSMQELSWCSNYTSESFESKFLCFACSLYPWNWTLHDVISTYVCSWSPWTWIYGPLWSSWISCSFRFLEFYSLIKLSPPFISAHIFSLVRCSLFLLLCCGSLHDPFRSWCIFCCSRDVIPRVHYLCEVCYSTHFSLMT